MREGVKKAVVAVPAGAAGLIAFLSSVRPKDARSALEEWAELVGVIWPVWLTPMRTIGISLGIALAFYAWYFRHRIPIEIRLRRTRSPTPESPPQLSLEEREQIQAVRYFWNRYGRDAADRLGTLFNMVVEDLKAKNYLAPLFDLFLAEFEAATRKMDDAVADASTMPLENVGATLNSEFAAYVRAYIWLQRIHVKDIQLSDEPYKRKLDEWQQAHALYKKELDVLHERPEHRGRLSTLRNANDSPDLFLPKPSSTPPSESSSEGPTP